MWTLAETRSWGRVEEEPGFREVMRWLAGVLLEQEARRVSRTNPTSTDTETDRQLGGHRGKRWGTAVALKAALTLNCRVLNRHDPDTGINGLLISDWSLHIHIHSSFMFLSG